MEIVIQEIVYMERPACDCCSAEPRSAYSAIVDGVEVGKERNTEDGALEEVLEHLGYSVKYVYADDE